ncbi:lysozyme inhibitor LprI family protein [Rhodobaculum claviforme]|uniref:Lysozyme inhibitor LprI-like N-terminal domain-containing protein n=1 Tax=Rhodobaculum claviforme TaxID=1549854 RepID=A0A934TKH7_9RHOB|nr:lysozyme inhibitor LprI family protein [Rhodobaculum claviforme]MBK5926892.1 hypothetical protein [Rhodobaculum claviforme]
MKGSPDRIGRGATAGAVAALAVVGVALASVSGSVPGSVSGAGRAAADPAFDPAPTDRCVAEAAAQAPARSGHGVLDCAGRAAVACMAAPGGDTTVGMIDCLAAELRHWEDRMAAALAIRRQTDTAEDADMDRLGATGPRLAPALEAMQGAWTGWRDAACLYEQAQWRGGTGAGPATMACHLLETARQTLRLEGWWAP